MSWRHRPAPSPQTTSKASRARSFWSREATQARSTSLYPRHRSDTSAGIGKETCRALLAHGAKVYLGARSADKGNAAVEELKRSTGKTSIVFHQLDLADLKAIKTSAQAFLKKEGRLDQLYCNAGVMAPPAGSITADGIEMQFGTNVLGHHALICHLLPLLLKTARDLPKGSVRVVCTSSSGHDLLAPASGIVWEDISLSKSWYPSSYRQWVLYGQSKCIPPSAVCEGQWSEDCTEWATSSQRPNWHDVTGTRACCPSRSIQVRLRCGGRASPATC